MLSIRFIAPLLLLAMVVSSWMPRMSTAQATELRLPAIFSDHMIVQRDQPVRVWGWSAPGDTIAIALGEASAEAVADGDGAWVAELPPFPAGGPHTLTVAGPEMRRFENVLVGDVWIAGGQSNMEWPVVASDGAEETIAAANYPQIRLMTVERSFAGEPGTDVISSGWHEVTPGSVRDFSAVAYYFGRTVHQEVGVPIGLLESNWGGSTAEAWASAEKLAELPDFEAVADSMLAGTVTPQSIYDRELAVYERRMTDWARAVRQDDPGFTIEGAVWAHPSFTPADWDTMDVPGSWEERGLPGFDGVAWFRKTFEIPAAWLSRPLRISLGRVDDADSTWINGQLIGGSADSSPREYVVPTGVIREGTNVVTVRVFDEWGPGGIRGRAEEVAIWPDGSKSESISLAGEWAYRTALHLSDLPPLPRPPGRNQIVAGLYNAMIAPIRHFPVKGVIWYQGESNADRAYQYRTLFPAVIEDWREQFGLPEMPFLYVQLANFMDMQMNPNVPSAWAELREAQTMALQVPNTAMAVAIDVGEANDIHPRDKQTVGHRLALAALGTVYERQVVHSGPQYVGMRIDGDAVRLLFSHVGSGLVARGGPLRGFALAGPDGEFRWAEARIEDNVVVVRHRAIDDPRAVRYGWANNPPVNLYNREGLPAIPFRTDDLPVSTQPR